MKINSVTREPTPTRILWKRSEKYLLFRFVKLHLLHIECGAEKCSQSVTTTTDQANGTIKANVFHSTRSQFERTTIETLNLYSNPLSRIFILLCFNCSSFVGHKYHAIVCCRRRRRPFFVIHSTSLCVCWFSSIKIKTFFAVSPSVCALGKKYKRKRK